MAAKKENTKERFHAALIQLAKERGFANVTIKDICNAVGCSEGTFYYHFKSMQGLMNSLHDWESTITADILLEVMALPSPWEKLWRIHRSFVEKALSLGAGLYWAVYMQFTPGQEDSRIESFHGINRFIGPLHSGRASLRRSAQPHPGRTAGYHCGTYYAGGYVQLVP